MPYVLGDFPASSVEDFLAQQVHGRTDGKDRLYAGIYKVVDNLGAGSFINQYEGKVARTSMTLLEMALLCKDPNADPDTDPHFEQVGVAISRDRLNRDRYDETKPVPTRLMAEFFTAGYNALGDDNGGWAGGDTKGFVPAANVRYGPGEAIAYLSTLDGVVRDSYFEIRNIDGDWWVAHNHTWLGYYPAYLFDEIQSRACEIHWYGEVYDKSPEVWSLTDMGSGNFAAEGLGRAAYFRLPAYRDLAGMPQWPDGASPSKNYDPLCYTSSGLLTGGPLFDRIVYTDGPGGDSPGCN
jgi:hypothetical protein